MNPVDIVKREVGLQSNRLDQEVRDRVEKAIEQLGGRVTVGDVAAKAGIKLSEADECLKALAYDTLGVLEVSSEGDVVYAFKPGFRGALRSKSLLQRGRRILNRASGAASYLARISFGTALIASVVLVWLALLVLLSGRDRDDRRSGSSGGGYYGGGGGINLFMNVTDLFFYWDPYYYRTTARRAAEEQKLNFVEAIFSFVFGDGDPNADYDERRWKELGRMIQSKGGIVTAEEMAPFLEPPQPSTGRDATAYYPDESFVLPALIKFGGEAVVDDGGHLLYKFPSLQRTAVQGSRSGSARNERARDAYDVPLEQAWDFTAADEGQVLGTVLLGGANAAGVAMLSNLLAQRGAAYYLASQGLGFIPGLMPAFTLYAAAFFAIPAVRWFLNASRNRDIEARNDARVEAAQLLSSNAGGKAARALADKLAAAQQGRAAGPKLVGTREDMVFTTERDVSEQSAKVELEDWDRRSGGGARQGRQRSR